MNEQPFAPHPNLSDELNNAIAISEAEGGAYIEKLPVGKSLRVKTRNTVYFIERVAEGREGLTIQGHPRYCAEPTKAYILGSTFGGSAIKLGFVGRGLYLEFTTDKHPSAIVTSQVQEVEEI